MKIFHEFKEAQARMKELQANESLQNALEFAKELESLMKKFKMTGQDVIGILSPSENEDVPVKKKKISQRVKRKYRHSLTGEVIECGNANNKTLKAWISELNLETPEVLLID